MLAQLLVESLLVCGPQCRLVDLVPTQRALGKWHRHSRGAVRARAPSNWQLLRGGGGGPRHDSDRQPGASDQP